MTKRNRGLLIVIISLVVAYLLAGILLSVKTYATYNMSSIPQDYSEDSFISVSDYVKLSPYESLMFDENGAVRDGYSSFQCDTDYFLLFPFWWVKDGKVVMRGIYSYSYRLQENGDERKSSASGEITVCFDISLGNVRIDDISYGL